MIEKTENGVSYMTSDAKVGLLLGLVFIVIIAFLINGLPGLISKGSSEMAVNPSVPTYKGTVGLTEKADKAVDLVSEYDPLKFKVRDYASKNDLRFKDSNHVAKSDNENSSDKNNPFSTKKFYTVKSGDSLGKIAIKIYGREIGNKQATVDLIFQTNSRTLSSPDDIAIDQKLIMPSLGGDQNLPANNRRSTIKKSKEGGLMKTGMFEKVGIAFKNVLSKDKKGTSPLSVYTVKDGDSLWDIASKKLGNGSRYEEILKLNNSILAGLEDVAPGMKLKIPQK